MTTFAPQTLRDLAALWVGHGGVNLGIVGDTAHATKGVSYHLGRSQLISTAYSIQTARDKAGLTDAASAIDLGKLDGSYAKLRAFSDWLARRCVKNEPGTGDIREVIYSPDGTRVLGFKDGIDYLIPDYGDDSHLTHTHISWYRDSEKRDKRPVFATYWLPDTSTGGDMGEFVVPFAKPLPFAITGSARSFDASPPYAELDAVSGATQAEAAVYVSQTAVPHGAFVRIITGATGRRLVAAASGTLGGSVDCTALVEAARKEAASAATTATRLADKAVVTAAIDVATLKTGGLL
jgi:hypothetical protein